MQRWDHVAEFLKAELRQGIVVKPWVYESLAIALRNSGGSTEEIERAELSTIDLQPTDSQGFLKAAKTMGELKHYDRALAFCRQASLLEPNTPYAYAEALTYADATDDLEAMQWASGNLLKQDWPVRNKDIQQEARARIESRRRSKLDLKNRMDESNKLRTAVQEKRHRDLIVKLSWQGEANLDLKVKEPTGSLCSSLNRTTIGGGTLIGDTLSDMNHETYMAAEAFSGEYEITVDSVWDHRLSKKAQITVIRHQGTKDETIDPPITVDLTKNVPVKVTLENGRRTETAYVPPPSSQQTPDAALVPQSQHDKILAQLRDLADPETVVESKGFRSSFGSPGASLASGRSGRSSRRALEVEPERPDAVSDEGLVLRVEQPRRDGPGRDVGGSPQHATFDVAGVHAAAGQCRIRRWSVRSSRKVRRIGATVSVDAACGLALFSKAASGDFISSSRAASLARGSNRTSHSATNAVVNGRPPLAEGRLIADARLDAVKSQDVSQAFMHVMDVLEHYQVGSMPACRRAISPTWPSRSSGDRNVGRRGRLAKRPRRSGRSGSEQTRRQRRRGREALPTERRGS